MESVHTSVLLHESIESLVPAAAVARKSGREPVYLDGTLGGAGHARAMAERLKGALTIVGMDRDPAAIERARASLTGAAKRVVLVNDDFRRLDRALDENGIGPADMILFDLGLSSDELESSGRGFSFRKDEPLLMTFGDPAGYPFTARDILNSWKEEDIANVIFGYGEESYARRIARAIVVYREKKPFETTDELTEVVRSSVPAPYRYKKTHPATKTFQALRIAVNDELGAAKEGLSKGYDRLVPGGRMSVITFHSLEDRIVKDFMRAREKEGATLHPRKAVKPSAEEIAANPRSRSAKLRTIERAEHFIERNR